MKSGIHHASSTSSLPLEPDLVSMGCIGMLWESPAAYLGHFEGKKGHLSPENSRFWDLSIHHS
jgi:hypothetical protein